ncbi:MAG TPA: amidohydrolase family protein [Blastocatellia bacterium]|nr:amidohydrolase family protein [Blastocatellia bacterium]
MSRPAYKSWVVFSILALICVIAFAQAQAPQRSIQPGPDRKPGEGEGPFERLVIRGATMIDGAGAPPIGPVDIVIENNRIREIRSVGYPKVPINEARRPAKGVKEIDAGGMYVMPGLVDCHAHIGGAAQGTPAEYVYKLWMAHGVTTIRDPGSGNGVDWTLNERERSAKNQIVAPRIFVYVRPGGGWDRGQITTPELAREYVRWAKQKGADGFKVIGGDSIFDPEILGALLDEAKKLQMGTTTHMSQTGVARTNVIQAARMGMGSMEHWYGLPESLFADRIIQDFPLDYNYNDESHRFGQAGRLWKQAAPPGSKKWNEVMDELIKLNFTIDPTFTIYEASRDLMRAMNAEWHDRYTLPSLWKFYQPSREAHGSYWFNWTTQDEVEWKNNFRLWMAFVNEFKNRGGRVTTGSDSGFIYKTYGFEYIRELELLQEAGFHPLEVIRSATFNGAELLSQQQGRPMEFGVIRPGKLADLIITPENPVANLKVLYGTGAIRLNDQTGQVERVGGVKWTIKDGIVYDAKKLLEDVAQIVEKARTAQKAPQAGGGATTAAKQK